ncbi:MAG: hypothetical protein GY788_06755 [bacterium]|nr:hypothetical protein [bacterium]
MDTLIVGFVDATVSAFRVNEHSTNADTGYTYELVRGQDMPEWAAVISTINDIGITGRLVSNTMLRPLLSGVAIGLLRDGP